VGFGLFQRCLGAKEKMLCVLFMNKSRIVHHERWSFFLLKLLAF
jgi:hypothetical protein